VSAIRIAVLQPPAPDFSRADEAWEELLSRIDDAAQDEPRLVLLPEASYPAWFLGQAASTPPSLPDERLIADLAARARLHDVYLAAGLVLGRPEAPVNAAVLIAPDGTEVARAHESQPAPWFRPGGGPAATMIDGAPVALFAGSDHLDPRWSEAIADARTQLLIVTGAPRGWAHAGGIAGPPTDAILAARAAETGAWLAGAGRTGVEGDAVGYTGGAGVVSPREGWVARAPADRAGIVLHECELTPPQPGVSPLPPAVPPSGQAPPPAEPSGDVQVAVLALDPSPSAVDLMESVRAAIRAAATLGARLVVLPDLTGPDPRAVSQSEVLPMIEAVTAETRVAVIAASAERAGGNVYRAVTVVEDGVVLANHRQSVLTEADRAAGFTPGVAAPAVLNTRNAGRVGLLSGREALAPSGAALLRQRGSRLLAWCAGADDRLVAAVARTRAWEQGVSVAAAGTSGAGAVVAGPRGDILAITTPGTPMLAHATVARR
jgi:predicted amidohydrolase